MYCQAKRQFCLASTAIILTIVSLGIYLQQDWYVSSNINSIILLFTSAIAICLVVNVVQQNTLLFLYKTYTQNKKYTTLRTLPISQILMPQFQKKKLIRQTNKQNRSQKQQRQNQSQSNIDIEKDQVQELYSQSQKQQQMQSKPKLNFFSKRNNFDLKDLVKVKQAIQNKMQVQQEKDNTLRKQSFTSRKQSFTSYSINFDLQSSQPDRQRLQQKKYFYNKKYKQYKETLRIINEEQPINIENSIKQTKETIRNIITQNINLQVKNLTNIQKVVQNNFKVFLKPLSTKKKEVNRHSQQFSSLKDLQEKFKNVSLQEKTFTQMFNQIKLIEKGGDTALQFIGDKSKLKDVYYQLKLLIKQRASLDAYLNLKTTPKQFLQIRYQNIQNLRSISNNLTENQLTQHKIQKIFQKSQNIDCFVQFMTTIFNEKITKLGYGDQIKIVLNKPNFQNQKTQYIWIKKQKILAKNHYDVVYKSHIKTEKQQKNSLIQELRTKRREQNNQTIMYCMPGEQNVWIAMAFVRILILKLSQGFKDKLKMLPNDIKRLLAIYNCDLSKI